MAKHRAMNIRRAGAYVVKAAESRPARVTGKTSDRPTVPTPEDRRLAAALLRAKRG